MTTTFFPISSVCLLSGGDANHEKKGENIEGSQYLCSFLNPPWVRHLSQKQHPSIWVNTPRPFKGKQNDYLVHSLENDDKY